MLVGWVRFRRGLPPAPSVRETSVHSSLLRWLRARAETARLQPTAASTATASMLCWCFVFSYLDRNDSFLIYVLLSCAVVLCFG